MKHTPGPWKVEIHDGNMEVWNSNTFICSTSSQLFRTAISKSENRPNANLIAAAPDLLQALKKSYIQILELMNEGDFKRTIEFDAGYIIDAIAKAEGE